MNSVIHLEAFQERFVSGLIYSMLEGLGDGQSLVFTSATPLDDFRLQLESAGIEGICCGLIKKEKSLWVLPVSRKSKSKSHVCTGACDEMDKSS